MKSSSLLLVVLASGDESSKYYFQRRFLWSDSILRRLARGRGWSVQVNDESSMDEL